MNSKRVNNVISLLINEIKTNERPESAKELAKEKGVNVAKSFLDINHADENLPCESPKRNCPAESGQPGKSNHCVNSQEEKKTTPDEDNFDDDVIDEKEKVALEFYDDRIDIFEEEYVNKKYRFCTKSCDSSLCCCGCFIPVCYQSQRHETYVNQYRSLYAVNVRIEDKKIIHEHEINATDNTKGGKRSHSHGDPRIPPPWRSRRTKQSSLTPSSKKPPKEKKKGKTKNHKHITPFFAKTAIIMLPILK